MGVLIDVDTPPCITLCHSRCRGVGGHYNGHRGALAPQTPEFQYNCRGVKMSSLWAWAQKPNTIYVICHIADLSSTDTNYTLLQPHNEISRPLLKLGPQTHQLNDATPE